MKSIVYIGADVHKDTYSLCAVEGATGAIILENKVNASAKKIEGFIGKIKGMRVDLNDADFIVGYESGCLGYSLCRELKDLGIECVILATSTIQGAAKNKVVKNDRMDARMIATNINNSQCKRVHIPTPEEEAVANYMKMVDQHKNALKVIKQEINAFVLRLGFRFPGKSNWTLKHLKWLRDLDLNGYDKLTLEEYLHDYETAKNNLERLEQNVVELSQNEKYKEKADKLKCFKGIKEKTAMTMIANTFDFDRFNSANAFAAYLGLVPGENSSGQKENNTSITKMGNSYMRKAMVEAARACVKGKIGYKGKALKARQAGMSAEIIGYADKGTERIQRKYHKLLNRGMPLNKVITACAREFSCFVWGMMTGNIY